LVKTSEFLVPVGQAVSVRGLEFDRGEISLNGAGLKITAGIFNCLEEITENTAGNTDAARVAEFSKMEFQIQAYVDETGKREENRTLAQNRADAVMQELLRLGTPSWRLSAKGFDVRDRSASAGRRTRTRVEFVRTR